MPTRSGIRISGFPVEVTETADALTLESEGTRDLVLDAGSGKVGIGTSDPNAQLDIQDDTTSSANTGGQLRLSANDGAPMGDSHRLGVIEFTGAEDSSGTQVAGGRIEVLTDAAWTNVENGAAMYFYTTDGNASQTNVLKLDSNEKATFSGDVQVGGNVEIAGSSGDLVFEIDNDATNAANFKIENGAGNLRIDMIMNDGSADTKLTMKGQKVGINDTNPSHTLDVTGDINLTGGLSFDSGTAVTSIDTDLSSVSGSDDTLASAKAIKAAIDAVPTGDITGVTAGTGLSGGGTSGGVTLNIDSTVCTLTGSQTLTNKTLTTPKFADGGYIADANGNEFLEFEINDEDTPTSHVVIGSGVGTTSGCYIETNNDCDLMLGTGGSNSWVVSETRFMVRGGENAAAEIFIEADEGADNADKWKIVAADGDTLDIQSKISGSYVSMLEIEANGTAAESLVTVPGLLECKGLIRAVAAKTSSYVCAEGDYFIIASGSGTTITLPENADAGTAFKVKRVDGSNNITVSRETSDTIDGAATYVLDENYLVAEFTSDGSNWHVTSEGGGS